MNSLKFLLGTIMVSLITLGIYSCAKDNASSKAGSANQNVELRSMCGDNYNVAPTPDYTVTYVNGLCCYTFTFSGIASGLGYTIYGFAGGPHLGPPIVGNTTCSGTMSGSTILSCCLNPAVKSVNIVLTDGSCVSLDGLGCN